MTHQTNEELLKKFQASLSWWIGRKLDKRGADIIITEFLSFIPQPERLIFGIFKVHNIGNYQLTCKTLGCDLTRWFSTKQEALDFIKKYNLKLKE